MKRFTLWNSYVAITESKEFVDWNKTKIIGSFKCPAFSYRSSTQKNCVVDFCLSITTLYISSTKKSIKTGKVILSVLGHRI